jgi:predicted TIM-barrel fold metal-dependent hydrolase
VGGKLAFVDGDSHYYETRDAFTRHLEPRLRDKAIRVVRDGQGAERILVGERPFTFLPEYSFERMPRPGSLRAMLKLHQTPDYANQVLEEMRPEYVERAARLRWMDAHGLQASLLFPTLAVCMEHFLKHDPEQLYGCFRAFNRWLLEQWGFGADGRIFAAPLLSLCDLERAVEELEWVRAQGARAIALRAGPAYGRSPADPSFDPFWARVDEAELIVAFHVGESGYNESISVQWGEAANPAAHRQSALQWTCFYGDRPIMDTLAALIFGNLFHRFPRVRALSVENGSIWVPYLLKAMDKMGGMGRNGPWIGGRMLERPSEVFKRHVYVSPYHEEDIAELVGLIGAERVVFGSDYPHAEGLAAPEQYLEQIESLPAAVVRRIMRDNTAALLGLDARDPAGAAASP